MTDDAAPANDRHQSIGDDRLLTPAEVAARFRVNQKTVTRWAVAGRLEECPHPGGHWRFREVDIRQLLGRPDGSL